MCSEPSSYQRRVLARHLAAHVRPGQRFAVVLVHRVDVLVRLPRQRDRLLDFGCVGAHDDGRFLVRAERPHAVLHPGNDRVGQPLGAEPRAERLPEGHQQPHVRVVSDELGDAIPRVLAGEPARRAVMERNLVRPGEGVREVDVVEELDHPDAALVRFRGQPFEHLDVLGQLLVAQLLRFRVLRQLQERGERVAVPEVQRVHPVLEQEVQVASPLLLVVEEREILRRVAVVVLRAVVGDLGLLHADAGSAKHELRRIANLQPARQTFCSLDPGGQLERSVQGSGVVRAGNRRSVRAGAGERESLRAGRRPVFPGGADENGLASRDAFGRTHYLRRVAGILERGGEPLDPEAYTRRRGGIGDDGDRPRGAERKNEQ